MRWLLALAAVSVACLLSVGGSAQQNNAFDHFTTGFRLDGAHRTVDCESCHVAGVFQGTPFECVGCHTEGGRIRASARPAQHPLTTNFCEDCHRTTAWLPIARMNHDSIIGGTCTSCHNNVQSVGKPPQHPPTTAQCDTCHRTTGWTPVHFDHTGVTNACASCHDGVGATGKSAKHITTTNFCEDCHTTVRFSPALRVDHTQVIGTCMSCHNGTTATGKPTNHPVTTGSCDNCHTTIAWTPAK
jgi:predicted CXXCH cytochrome family protein